MLKYWETTLNEIKKEKSSNKILIICCVFKLNVYSMEKFCTVKNKNKNMDLI